MIKSCCDSYISCRVTGLYDSLDQKSIGHLTFVVIFPCGAYKAWDFLSAVLEQET